MHQGYVARTDIGATAAFGAIEQPVLPGLVEVCAFCEPVQLLGQQGFRADICAVAATDTGHLRVRRAALLDEDAVGGLDYRHVGRGDAQAHHRTADDHLVVFAVPVAAGGEAVLDRGADEHLQVDGVIHLPGHRDIARNDGFPARHGPVHRGGRGHVVYDDAYVYRQAMAGNVLAGQCPYELVFAAGRIAGGHLDQFQVIIDQRGQRVVRKLHVVLDRNDAMSCLHRVADHAGAGDDVSGFFLDQAVIAGDLRFTFNTVNNQCVDGVLRALH